MQSVLIVSSSNKGLVFFEDLLRESTFSKIVTATSGNEARRLLIENDFDLCIVNAPLIDEFGTNLAQNIATRGISQVLLTVKSELFDEVSEKLENYGIYVIARPINRQLFWSALKLLSATHKKLLGLQNENVRLQLKIEEIRLVNRAKAILIQYLKMTEQEAHKYIEKQAMDLRITKREVATSILNTYES